MAKDLAYYMSLSYPVELTREDGLFVASHPDLPGCVAQGDTADESIANLDEARESWIAVGLEDKAFIPEPLPSEFSGRLSLRIPASLHGRLARSSGRQGVSLNQLLNVILAEWASGIDFKDKAVAELRALLSASLEETTVVSESESVKVTTKTRTETHLRLVHGAAGNQVSARVEVGH
jgi:predicted RNase H-like HicB family nuclease